MIENIKAFWKKAFPKIAYQDVWVNGKAIYRGRADCIYRYEIIKEVCAQFQRPITVLDIGANMGYFSFRLAEEFEGSFFMLEGGDYQSLLLTQLCLANKNPKITLLRHQLNLQTILRLAQVEHFDLVLGLSVIHHFSEPYQQVLDAMSALGSYLIVEVPLPGEQLFRGEKVDKEPLDFSRYRHELLTRTNYCYDSDRKKAILRKLYFIDCGNKCLTKPSLNGKDFPSPLLTHCNFSKREVYHPLFKKLFFLPEGMNLFTFMEMNGVLPSKKEVLAQLRSLEVEDFPSLSPSDIYFTGKGLKVVSPPHAPNRDSKADLALIIELYEKGQLSTSDWEHHFSSIKTSSPSMIIE